jgi:CubicO group peptidase (beta-lactamase class C family)
MECPLDARDVITGEIRYPGAVSDEPSIDDWTARPPAERGMDPDGLAAAIAYHRAHETRWRPDFLTAAGRYIGVADEPPAAGDVLGPVRPRGGPNGIVVRGGDIVAEWGDTRRADMTFSVAKSYLAVLAGLAVARGLIASLDDPVRPYALDAGFDSPQNRDVTWRHLLQQTSEWQGTVWGKPDTIDHNRDVGKSELGDADKGQARPLRPPGTLWEYNDVRVNRLSLSLLQVFRRPLPEVLRHEIMDPIGASTTWEWVPYDDAWITIDGARMPSVPGGSHWGGGLWMSTRDHARFGLLVHRAGRWGGRELVPGGWIAEMRRPCPINPEYGLLWWLNTGRRQLPSASESSYAARGAGSNVIWIDPDRDLVVVVRWIDKPHVAGFVERVIAAVH